MAGVPPPPPARSYDQLSNEQLLKAQELNRTLPEWMKDALCEFRRSVQNSDELLWVQVYCPEVYDEIAFAKATAPPPPAPTEVDPAGESPSHYTYQYGVEAYYFYKRYTQEERQEIFAKAISELSLTEWIMRAQFAESTLYTEEYGYAVTDGPTNYIFTSNGTRTSRWISETPNTNVSATNEELSIAAELNRVMFPYYKMALCDPATNFQPGNDSEALWVKIYCVSAPEIQQSAGTSAPPPATIYVSDPVTLGSSLTNYLGAEISATRTNGSFRNKVASGQGNEIVGPADSPRVTSSTLTPSSVKINDLSAAIGYLEGNGATPLAAKATAAVLADVAKAQNVGVMSLIDQTQQNDKLSLKDKRAYQAINQVRPKTSQLSSCKGINNRKSVRGRYLLP